MVPTEPWPIIWSCSEVETSSPAATGVAARAATQLLWSLSGGQGGPTTAVLRPCRRSCDGTLDLGGYGAAWPGWGYPWPVNYGGSAWVNLGCGGCYPDPCGCATLSEAQLPQEVTAVTQVKVDGVALAPTAYRLDVQPGVAGKLLVRTDGGTWPRCQQLALDDTRAGTWSATVTMGQPAGELAQLAVGEVACEFLRGLNGQDCRLPREVVSLARQGVTLTYPDPSTLASSGLLGLPISDRFLLAVNPDRRRRRARTISPDTLGPRRVGV